MLMDFSCESDACQCVKGKKTSAVRQTDLNDTTRQPNAQVRLINQSKWKRLGDAQDHHT
jgi:hypothetical protein